MNPDQKTRLLIGTLIAAVILVLGYGLVRELGRSPKSVVPPVSQGASEAVAPSPEAAPGRPPMRLQADTAVTAGTSGHQAAIKTDTDLAYAWSIQGGTIEGIASGASITWTAGTGKETVLTCTGTNSADQTNTVTLRVPLRQPPAITRFEAVPPVITAGSGTKLSWDVNNVQTLTLEPGGQDLSKNDGSPVEVKPEQTTRYTLKVANGTGVTATRELEVKVVPPPEISSLRAEPMAGSPGTFNVIGEFKGKAELKNGSQVVAGSDASPLRIQMTNLKEGSTLTLTVTNEAGASVASTLTYNVAKK
jgi:hypothetical protein